MARRKKNEEEPKQENQDKLNNDSDETFGLPEVEYEPLKRDEPVSEPTPEPEPVPVEEPVVETPPEPVSETVAPESEPSYHEEEVRTHQDDLRDYAASYHYEPEKPVWPKVVGILLLLLILGGGAYYYFGVYEPAQREAKAREAREQRLLDAEAKKKREAELAEQAKRDAEQRRLDSLANLPKTGTIELLTARTGQYYIVVASAIDDDLLMDYANKLITTGKSVKIIPPFGKKGKFYRLAIESKGDYAEAQASADGTKGGEFGDQLWVVRY